MKNKKNIILVLIIIVTGVILLKFNYNTDNSGEKIDIQPLTSMNKNVQYSSNSNVYIHPSGDDKFYYINNNSVSLENMNFEADWTVPNNLQNIDVEVKNDFVAVTEYGISTSVSVYNENGLAYDVSTQFPVLNMSVSSDGHIGVLSNKEKTYRIQAFDSTGKEITSTDFITDNIIPITLAISDDGRVLAVSTVDLNYLDIRSDVLFIYTYDEDGKVYLNSDGVFAGMKLTNEVVGKIIATSERKMLVCTDENIYYLDLKNSTKEEIFKIPLANKVEELQIINEKYFAISVTNPIIKEQAKELNTVIIYNFKGDETGSFNNDGKKIDIVEAATNGAYVVSNNTIFKIDYTGKVIWEYYLKQNVFQIAQMKEKNKLILVFSKSAELYKSK